MLNSDNVFVYRAKKEKYSFVDALRSLFTEYTFFEAANRKNEYFAYSPERILFVRVLKATRMKKNYICIILPKNKELKFKLQIFKVNMFQHHRLNTSSIQLGEVEKIEHMENNLADNFNLNLLLNEKNQ